MDKTRRDEQDAWERTEGIEHKLTKIGVGGKAYYDASQIKIKRNKVLIASAKLENKQLRATLNSLKEQERCALGRSDLRRLGDRVEALRKCYDDQRNRSIATALMLESQTTNTKAARTDCEQSLDNNTAPLVRLRALEATLQKALQSLEEARELKSSYEATLKPICDERTIYNSQMDTLGRTSRRREGEYEQMTLMYYDSLRAREESRSALEEVGPFYRIVIARDKSLEMLRSQFPVGVRYHDLFMEPQLTKHTIILTQIQEASPTILEALNFPTMKELFHYVVTLQRNTDYLDHLSKELKEIVDQLKSGTLSPKSLQERIQKMKRKIAGKSGPDPSCSGGRRKKGALGDTLRKMVEGTKRLMSKIHKFDSRGRASSLISVIRGTKRLVDKIHEGEMYNSEDDSVKKLLLQCEAKLISWLKGFEQWLIEKKAEKTGKKPAPRVEGVSNITEE